MPRSRKLRKAVQPAREADKEADEPRYVPPSVEKWSDLALRGEVLLESFKFLPHADLTQCELVSDEFHRLLDANRELCPLLQVEVAKMDWTINPEGKQKNKRTEAYYEVDVEPQHCITYCAAHWQKPPKGLANALGGKLIVFDEDDYPNSVQFEMGVKQELLFENHMVSYSEESKRGRIFWLDGRNVAPKKFVPHLLHFFHHLRHPHVFFHDVTLYPFDMAFWRAVDSGAVRNHILCCRMSLESSGDCTPELFAWLLDFSRSCVRAEHLKWDVDLELAAGNHQQSAPTSSRKRQRKAPNEDGEGGEGAKGSMLDQLVEWILAAGGSGSPHNLEISITSGLEEFLDSLINLVENSTAPVAPIPALTLCFARYRDEAPQAPYADRLLPYFVRSETNWIEGKHNMQLECVSTYAIRHKDDETASVELRMKLLGKSLNKKEWERRHGAAADPQ